MSTILTTLQNHPVKQFGADETVLEQGARTDLLYVLIEGAVEVLKDQVKVASSSEPGAVFGDLSVLLRCPHTASVRTVRPSSFHIVPDPWKYLEENPSVCLHLCVLIAQRLDAVNKYLVNVKHQFAGHDHMGMVDGALDALMHRHPRPRVAPRASTIRDPEILD